MALEGWEMHVFDRLPSHSKNNPTLNYQSCSPSRHSGHADCSMKMTIHPTTTESSFKPPIPSDCLDELLPSSFYCLEEINKGAYMHNAKCPSELPLPDFFSPNWVQPGIDHNISAEESSSSEQSIDEQQQRSQTRKRKSMPKEKSKAATSTIASPNEWNTKSVFQAKRRNFAELTKEKDDSKSEVEQASHGSTDESSPKQAEHNGKPPEARKETYVHVRARRGQATDSHSLAERVRREKISERMKFLQDLVPGCNKITGKAVMLDEIINYVQSLQHQVEFLSMKLEAVNPQLDFNLEGLPAAKDVLGPAGMVFASDICVASDTSVAHSQFHQPEWEPAQVGVSCETGEHGMESAAAAVLRRIMNNRLLCMDGYGDAGSQISDVWDDDLQSVVRMGFGQNVTSQSFHEMFPTSHVKIAP